MATNQKHPSIEKFKDFVKRHPKLSQEVKSKKKTWQDLFEEWYLLGEEDESWKSFRDDETQEEKTEKKSDVIPQLLQSLKKMDVNQMQYHLTNVNSAIGNIQQLIQQFIPNSTKGSSPTQGVKNPFSFRKD
ncbi:cytosolic protein [Sutcliffiella horikoshii]|uniref:Cytosolic protein n=1 Tax=Sutcliffiella horikoshii TaxID=79883 RepID=A0A5D4T8A9_9BACI|nr:YlbD family protein [Sutcliffiella horikoshii]TYS70722.1 cytosolic protein [Sutcliffiella horikoshii]